MVDIRELSRNDARKERESLYGNLDIPILIGFGIIYISIGWAVPIAILLYGWWTAYSQWGWLLGISLGWMPSGIMALIAWAAINWMLKGVRWIASAVSEDWTPSHRQTVALIALGVLAAIGLWIAQMVSDLVSPVLSGI